MIRVQMEFYKDAMHVWRHFMARLAGDEDIAPFTPAPRDKRFKSEVWDKNPLFDLIKQSYLMVNHWAQEQLDSAHGLDNSARKRLDFYMQQYLDALAPTNFLLTNPDALNLTLESNGANLVRGLQNLRDDLARSSGVFQVSSTDKNAFAVGKNLATTPGKVVYQNDLVQLIQYSPQTEKVFQVPVLIIAPWINKYYILDLQPENSLIRWLVEQGYTVFVTSWVNPGPGLANKRFEDYLREGVLETLNAVQKATGETQVNMVGYCIGGTLLATALAWLKAKGRDKEVRSATYLTTLLDFCDPGDISVFVDEVQLSELEEKMNERGYMDSSEMSAVFSALRANDMIWSFVVNNYLMGNEPFAFDLLYWNADSTRLPAAMQSFYLRNMYLQNKLIRAGGITLDGVPIDLHTVTTPSYMLSTIDDHIAPWKTTYRAMHIFKGPLRFVLSGSGHVGGVVNPPSRMKYGYWTNPDCQADADAWLKNAMKAEGSWWKDWHRWLQTEGYAGKKVSARIPGKGVLNALEDAPGSYVKVK
ncbi:MAG: class I poly(R)-hydroxyalkanoic acid synthase [Rickettsiales bacterium]|nr:class I poly(R)-hydroxyalkanoic acid synthase [Rickettsiales bacterium]